MRDTKLVQVSTVEEPLAGALLGPLVTAVAQELAKKLVSSPRREEFFKAIVRATRIIFEEPPPGPAAATAPRPASPKSKSPKVAAGVKKPCCTICHRPGHRPSLRSHGMTVNEAVYWSRSTLAAALMPPFPDRSCVHTGASGAVARPTCLPLAHAPSIQGPRAISAAAVASAVTGGRLAPTSQRPAAPYANRRSTPALNARSQSAVGAVASATA